MADLVDVQTEALVQSERVTVLLKHRSVQYTILKIQWMLEANGEGLFVHLPYFTNTRGALRNYRIDGPYGTQSQIQMSQGGTTTEHPLKYSHHHDGEAHFSQDGRIVTVIRTKTQPLIEYDGHLFTLNLWNLTGFNEASRRHWPNEGNRDSNVQIGWGHETREARRISGRVIGLLKRSSLIHFGMRPEGNQRVEPLLFEFGGYRRAGTVLYPPNDHSSDLVLVLIWIPDRERYQYSRSAMTFWGGFVSPLPADNPDSYLTGIVLMYGLDNFDHVRTEIGTHDLVGNPRLSPLSRGNTSWVSLNQIERKPKKTKKEA